MFRLILLVLVMNCIIVYSDSTNRLCKCGIEKIRKRIVGGREVRYPNQYPWMAGIITVDQSGRTSFCGGSLINSRFVLTAGHCVQSVPVGGIRVILGAHTFKDVLSLPSRKVSNAFVPSFNEEDVSHDFALLQLETPIDLRNFTPICLSQSPGPYKNLFAVGWGLTNSSRFGGSLSRVLKEVKLEQKTDSVCLSHWPRNFRPGYMICAGEDGSSPCQGDSGGPLASRMNGRVMHVGIVSFGDRDCGVTTGLPTVFTKVYAYRNVIREIVQVADEMDSTDTIWCG